MNLKKAILDTFEKEMNPWRPYTGDAGGQGWVNAMTGEVRYQDERPAPQEGTPDDTDMSGLPDPEEPVPDELEAEPPEWADILDPGDHVNIMGADGEEIEVEVIDDDPEKGAAEVETINGDSFLIGEDEILDDPLAHEAAEEPPDGWADGWSEPPDDSEAWADLNKGDAVEVYDTHRGEYVQGEVQMVDEDFTGEDDTYVSVQTDDGVYEFIEGEGTGSGEGAVVTAVEDVFDPDVMEEFDPYDDFGAYDDVVLYDEITGEVIEGEIFDRDQYSIRVEDEDGAEYRVNGDNRYSPLSEQGMADLELQETDMLDVERLTPDSAADLADHDGDLAVVEHPTEGTVTGRIDVVDHDEKGRHLYVGDSEVGIPLDDPEHPLSEGTDVESVENPYNEFDASIVPYLTAGDELVLSDGDSHWTSQVDAVSADGEEVKLDGGWMDADAIAEGIDGTEVVMTDADPVPAQPTEDAEWTTADAYETEDIVVGDSVWWEDEDGQPHTAVVSSVSDEGYVQTNSEDAGPAGTGTLPVEDLSGVAETGDDLPPSEVSPDYLDTGSAIAVAARADDGSIQQYEGIVTQHDDYSGDFALTTADGETVTFDADNFGGHDATASVTEQSVDVDFQSEVDPSEVDPGEVATDIEDQINLNHNRHKLGPDQKNELKGALIKKYGPEPVQEFYDLQSEDSGAWKRDSGTAQAETYERAFKKALGIDASARPKGGSRPSRELQAVAATAAELSQRHFAEQFGEGFELHRGTSSTGSHHLAEQFFLDPQREEYESPFLAINNFSTERTTAERFEGDGGSKAATVAWETSPDDVVAMHDYLFTEEGTHEAEEEITLRGDIDDIPAENVTLNASGRGGVPLDTDAAEWDEDQARSMEAYLDHEGENIAQSHAINETFVENALLIEDLLNNQHGIQTHYNDFYEAIHDRAGDYGIDPNEVQHPAAHGDGYQLPEGVTDVDDFSEGMEMTVNDDRFYMDAGNEGGAYVEVTDVDPDRGVQAVGEGGMEYWVEPEDVNEISYSPDPYGEGAEYLGEDSWDPAQFESGDQAYVNTWGGGPVEEGIVMDASEDGTVEVSVDGQSDYYDVTDPSDAARLAPMSAVEDQQADEVAETFTPGTNVHISNDIQGGPDAIDETGVVSDVIDHNGKPLYQIEDPDSGTTVQELYPEEMAEMAEPHDVSEGSGDPEEEVNDMLDDLEPDTDGGESVMDDVNYGTAVDFDHFTGEEKEGTVIGWNDDKKRYVVDYSHPDADPSGSQIMFVDSEDINSVYDEVGVDEAATDIVDDNDWFEQELPNGSGPDSTEGSVEQPDPVAYDEAHAGDHVAFEAPGWDEPEVGEVTDIGNDGTLFVDYGDEESAAVTPDDVSDYNPVDPSTVAEDDVDTDEMDEDVQDAFVSGEDPPSPDGHGLDVDELGSYEDVDFVHPDTNETIQGTVLDPPFEMGDPAEVQDVENSQTYLLWPDGSVESV